MLEAGFFVLVVRYNEVPFGRFDRMTCEAMPWLLGNRVEAASSLLVTCLLALNQSGGHSGGGRRSARRSREFVHVPACAQPLCSPFGRDLCSPACTAVSLPPASCDRNQSLEELQETPCGEGTWYNLF